MNKVAVDKRIAVILPAKNEAQSIAEVVSGFRKSLPEAEIYVFDNASGDRTAYLARAAGAIVRHEPLAGKGYVVRRMFADVEADIYVIADADGTNPPAEAPRLIECLEKNQLDMVVGARLSSHYDGQFRRGHVIGNRLISLMVNIFFNRHFTDVMSGYRAMTRRFVKSAPGWARRFEVEPMLNIHAAEVGAAVEEIETSYLPRSQGTVSKLNTYSDGLRVAAVILYLVKQARPILFFNLIALFFFTAGLAAGIPVIMEYIETDFVISIPLAVLASALMLLSVISVVTGLILDSVSHNRRELKRTLFLLADR